LAPMYSCTALRHLLNLTLVGLPASARVSAQVQPRVDLTLANNYLWHGLTHSSRWSFQPDALIVVGGDPLGAAIGTLVVNELGTTGGDAVTLRGRGRGGPGEVDVWTQAIAAAGDLTVTAGVTRYSFHGDSAIGGRPPSTNTTELYATIQLRTAYLAPRLEAWRDVDRWPGWYLQASGTVPVLAWPSPPYPALLIGAELGLNASARGGAQPPSVTPTYSNRGVTHTRLSLVAQLQRRRGYTSMVGIAGQLNFDDAVRLGPGGRRRDFVASIFATVALLQSPSTETTR
jgi:hypothetical protein